MSKQDCDSIIRVFIVDDQRMFQDGIRSRLEHEQDMVVEGEAGTAEEAFELLQEKTPEVVVLDIRLPGLSGIDAARVIRKEWPNLKIIMLTGYDFDQYVRAAARVGIDGYILKDAPQDDLVRAVRDVAAGGAVLPPSIASKVMKSYADAPWPKLRAHPDSLTLREIEVLDLVAEGLRNSDVAERLEISIRTVEAHVSSIMAKLGANTRPEIVRRAAQNNLIK
jgi:DNA-binding NarL/FixJ family response regulator